mgnify:CR=1 FL=1
MPLIRALFFLCGFMLLFSCATASQSSIAFNLTESTTHLRGWLSVRGEWTLFPMKGFGAYAPFTVEDDSRCVSLVNNTGQKRTKYRHLEGAFVDVTGYVMRYDELDDGESVTDQLLSKKYFDDQVVENFCLRDFIFVVSGIELAR